LIVENENMKLAFICDAGPTLFFKIKFVSFQISQLPYYKEKDTVDTHTGITYISAPNTIKISKYQLRYSVKRK